MDTILAVAHRHGLAVVEDAAQGVMASFKGKPLGSWGQLGAFSFHETKNIISGEGGALLVSEPAYAARAEIVREKGTDRSRFFRGQVDKYTWQSLGSSFLPGELTAAFLWAQLEEAESITKCRTTVWKRYAEGLAPLADRGLVRLPVVPADCQHNAHLFYVLVDARVSRSVLLESMAAQGVLCVSHYEPLHSSPAGLKYGLTPTPLPVTDDQAARLVRLPLWTNLSEVEQEEVLEKFTHTVLDLAVRH
jgi:dTDP-4-amino-4,6-dideoxygalactose transaminase